MKEFNFHTKHNSFLQNYIDTAPNPGRADTEHPTRCRLSG